MPKKPPREIERFHMALLDYYGHSTFGLTTDDGTLRGRSSTSVRESGCTTPVIRPWQWTCSS